MARRPLAAPGASNCSRVRLRSSKGRSITDWKSKGVATSVRSSFKTVPVPGDLSVIALGSPACSVALTVAVESALTGVVPWRRLKPSACTSIWYKSGVRLLIVKYPPASLLVVLRAPVSTEVTVTEAAEIGAPEAVVKRPQTSPYTDCAAAGRTKSKILENRQTASTGREALMRPPIKTSLGVTQSTGRKILAVLGKREYHHNRG